MSPVDLETLSRADGADPLPPGQRCTRCDYPLDGLTRGSVCPECGTPVRHRSSRVSDARDNLTDAPVEYLHRLSHAFLGLAVLGLVNSALQVGVVASAWMPTGVVVGMAVVMALAGAGWAGVVVVATTRRPFMPGMRVNPERELATARRLARASQWAWLVQGAFLAAWASSAGTAAAQWYLWGSQAAQIVGVLGFAPLCLWLAHLAEWGQHTSLGWRLRVSAGVLGVGGAFWTLLAAIVPLLPFGLVRGTLSLVGTLVFAGYALALGLFLFSQLQLADMSRWATLNARQAARRDERVLERRARRAFSGVAEAGTPLGELSARRGAEALDPCAGCGYDLTGIPAGSACPECGRTPEGDEYGFSIRRTRPPPTLDDTPLPLVERDPPPA